MFMSFRSSCIAGFLGTLAASVLLLTACSSGSGTPTVSGATNSQLQGVQQPIPQLPGHSNFANELASGSMNPVCAHNPGQVICYSGVFTHSSTAPFTTCNGSRGIQGYGPCNLWSAYNLKSAIKAGCPAQPCGLVADVVPDHDPALDSDLNVYRTQFDLGSCRESTGCLTQVSQMGGTPPPTESKVWAEEESLDVDMISANCPKCKIVVVEANAFKNTDMEAAEAEAVKLGAVSIANPWGFLESNHNLRRPAFNYPGIAITAAAGDTSQVLASPADFKTVIAVVGTTLRKGGGGTRGWTETVWNGTGSGCSQLNFAPTWQVEIEKFYKLTGCYYLTGRARVVGDIAYDADLNTGIACYDSFENAASPWGVCWGTSIGAAALAALYALAGNARSEDYPAILAYNNVLHGNYSAFNDITQGTNGSCDPIWLCEAGPGYDAPSGVGSPNGIGGF